MQSGASKKQAGKFGELKAIRVEDFRLIPRRLFDRVKGRAWKIDLLLEKQGLALARHPLTFLYVFADGDNMVRGFLWGMADPLLNCLNVHVLSVDPEFQDGQAVPWAMELLGQIREQTGLDKIRCSTRRPKALEKYGWMQSDWITMEV